MAQYNEVLTSSNHNVSSQLNNLFQHMANLHIHVD